MFSRGILKQHRAVMSYVNNEEITLHFHQDEENQFFMLNMAYEIKAFFDSVLRCFFLGNLNRSSNFTKAFYLHASQTKDRYPYQNMSFFVFSFYKTLISS